MTEEKVCRSTARASLKSGIRSIKNRMLFRDAIALYRFEFLYCYTCNTNAHLVSSFDDSALKKRSVSFKHTVTLGIEGLITDSCSFKRFRTIRSSMADHCSKSNRTA